MQSVSIPCDCGVRNFLDAISEPNSPLIQTSDGFKPRFLIFAQDQQLTCQECHANIKPIRMEFLVDGTIWSCEDANSNDVNELIRNEFILAKLKSDLDVSRKWWKNAQKSEDVDFIITLKMLEDQDEIVLEWKDGFDFYRSCRDIPGWSDKRPPVLLEGASMAHIQSVLDAALANKELDVVEWAETILEKNNKNHPTILLN